MTSCPRRLRYSNQIRKEISRKVATGAGRASGKSSPLARGNCGWATIQTRKTADPNCSTVSLQDMLYHVCLIQVYIYIYNFTYLLPVSHRNPNSENVQSTSHTAAMWALSQPKWHVAAKVESHRRPFALATVDRVHPGGVLGMQTHAT